MRNIMKNEEMEEMETKSEESIGYEIAYSEGMDRIYIIEQRSIFGENYTVLISIDGRTEEKIFATLKEAKKFVKEVMNEIEREAL
jgi:Tol biopolymer transport system component